MTFSKKNKKDLGGLQSRKTNLGVDNSAHSEDLIFTKINYRWTLYSILIVFVGFLLMCGDENIYGFQKTILSPFVILIGFAIGFVAIFKNGREEK